MKIIETVSECEDKMLDPRTFRFRMKDPLRHRINDLLSSRRRRKAEKKKEPSDDSDDDKLLGTLRQILEQEEEDKTILLTYDDLSNVHRCLQRLDPTYNLFFHQLLDECRAFLLDQRDNKELSDRLKKLQFDFSNKSYQEMTKAIIDRRATGKDIGSEVRQLRPVLIALINSLMVIAGTFFFVFKAVEYSMPVPNVTVQVMSGLVAATIVAVAELYFMVKII